MNNEPTPQVRIVLTGHGTGQIYINGQAIPNVRRIEITAEPGELNTATLEILAATVMVEGPMQVVEQTQLASPGGYREFALEPIKPEGTQREGGQ